MHKILATYLQSSQQNLKVEEKKWAQERLKLFPKEPHMCKVHREHKPHGLIMPNSNIYPSTEWEERSFLQ